VVRLVVGSSPIIRPNLENESPGSDAGTFSLNL
jgi:hypothetical protein